jgi:membrane-associated phospholipid phosphatase
MQSLALALLLTFCIPVSANASNTETAGDVLFVLIPLTGIATATVKGDREGQVQFLKSFLTNTLITAVLKASIDKTRPDGDCCDSFPSGHTSFSFMGASFLHTRYGKKYGIPAYAAATFVGYSRVSADRHHVEDVLAGAAIGYLSSYLFTSRYAGLEVTPVARHNFIGVAFARSW